MRYPLKWKHWERVSWTDRSPKLNWVAWCHILCFFTRENFTVVRVFGGKKWERKKMCQENNSAEAMLQKYTKLQFYFHCDFSAPCQSVHRALQQVLAPKAPKVGLSPLGHTQKGPGKPRPGRMQ